MEILAVKERLQVNLTGSQIAKILDKLLWLTVQPILLHTQLGRRLGAEILVQSYSDGRLSVSPLPRQQYINTLFTAIVTPRAKDHANNMQALKLERSAFSCLADYCVSIYKYVNNLSLSYIKAQQSNDSIQARQSKSTINKICDDIGSTEATIGGALRYVIYYLQQYRIFKEYVAEKFYRHSYEESKKSIALTSIHVDVMDLFANYLLAIDRALDRYSPDKGSLTTYLRWWYTNAKTAPEFPHQYSESYSLPTAERKAMTARYGRGESQATNFAYSLEDAESITVDDVETIVTDLSQQKELVKIFSYARNARLSLLKLDIPFQLTELELEQQKLSSKVYRTPKAMDVPESVTRG
jgi:hypothetical protein